MTAAVLLERLSGVRQTAPDRWLARCPAHDDRSPSLSVRELSDGRVLVHDFGGCGTGEVLAAVGMAVPDLFPDPRPHHLRPFRSGIPAADKLLVLERESAIVYLLAVGMRDAETLSDADRQRLAEAVTRIQFVTGQGVRR